MKAFQSSISTALQSSIWNTSRSVFQTEPSAVAATLCYFQSWKIQTSAALRCRAKVQRSWRRRPSMVELDQTCGLSTVEKWETNVNAVMSYNASTISQPCAIAAIFPASRACSLDSNCFCKGRTVKSACSAQLLQSTGRNFTQSIVKSLYHRPCFDKTVWQPLYLHCKDP